MKELEMLEESQYDYYEILGCERTALYEDVKHAYHELVLRNHPDKSNDLEQSITKFQQIDKAWKVLRDPKLRREYDAECRRAELEAEGALIYARIKSTELEPTEDTNNMAYPCRCGSNYLLHSRDLEEENSELYVPCQECTFSIVVET